MNREEPAVVHYFVDHAAIALASESPEVTFAYVQGWTQRTAGFDTFLRRYRGLIDRLPLVRVLYLTTRPGLVGLAEKSWSKVFYQARRARSAPTPEHLSAHLQLSQRFEKAGARGASQKQNDNGTWVRKCASSLPSTILVRALAACLSSLSGSPNFHHVLGL